MNKTYHSIFRMNQNYSMIGKNPPKGMSFSDFICTFAMSFGDVAIPVLQH